MRFDSRPSRTQRRLSPNGVFRVYAEGLLIVFARLHLLNLYTNFGLVFSLKWILPEPLAQRRSPVAGRMELASSMHWLYQVPSSQRL